jgi:hypothetical protein
VCRIEQNSIRHDVVAAAKKRINLIKALIHEGLGAKGSMEVDQSPSAPSDRRHPAQYRLQTFNPREKTLAARFGIPGILCLLLPNRRIVAIVNCRRAGKVGRCNTNVVSGCVFTGCFPYACVIRRGKKNKII